jgi:general secretion pathway protein L
VTVCRIRVGRDLASTDAYEWVMLDPAGSAIDSGASPARRPPVGTHCELIISSDLVLLEQIPAPAARQRRITSALRFLVEDSVISDPERVHVATGPVSANDRLPVAIIDRQWLGQVLARLEAAGLAVRHAYPECLLPECPPRTWVVVCDGKSSFARTGNQEGFALDLGESAEVPVALRLALDQVRNSGSAPDRLLARVAPGVVPPPTGAWAEELGIPVEIGPPWRWTDGAHRAAIDLLQGEFAPRVTERNWTRVLRRPAILAAVLAALSVAATALDWAMKAYERRALVAQMAETYRRSFGENAIVVDPPLQMTRALEQMRRQAGEFSAGDFIPLFAAVTDRMLDPARHRIESIGYADGVLTLSVRPVDASQFSTQFNDMRAHSSIPGVDIKLDPAEATGRFSLRATAGKGGGK